jgi:hypothetical protein
LERTGGWSAHERIEMKEIIEKILSYLPGYLTQLGSCFIASKTFIATKNIEEEYSFQEALIFFGITSALIVLATASLPP